jgi:hypothetical protein
MTRLLEEKYYRDMLGLIFVCKDCKEEQRSDPYGPKRYERRCKKCRVKFITPEKREQFYKWAKEFKERMEPEPYKAMCYKIWLKWIKNNPEKRRAQALASYHRHKHEKDKEKRKAYRHAYWLRTGT